MKTLKLIVLAAFALFFSQCKTTAPTAPGTSSETLNEVAQTLDTIETQVLLYADSTGGNDRTALGLTAKWLQKQTDIQSVSVLDSSYLYFTLQSGLMGMYYLDEIDNNGMSLARGGDGSGGNLEGPGILSTNTITNPSVLIFAPVFNEFYTAAEFQNVLDKLSNSGLGLNVTVKKDSDCTIDVVDHFADYGLVIIDTHGSPNGFLTGLSIIDSLSPGYYSQELREINTGNVGYDKFKAGQVMLARGLQVNPGTPGWQRVRKHVSQYPLRVFLTSNYILGLRKLSGTVVFGNMCFSGQSQPIPAGQGVTTPIQTAFANLNPISYYGYAYASGFASSVSNGFAKAMEDSLLTQFITNTDSTGHCYLQQNGTEYYDAGGLAQGLSKEKLFFKHFGADDYSYQKCGDSLLDSRDGQKYATVCIGKQVWMAQNLNFNAPGSITYNNDPANGKIYGRMYDWATAMGGAPASNSSPSGVQGVCPKGWHIPSAPECAALSVALGGDIIAGGAMKSTSPLWQSPNTGAINSSGFSFLPGGFSNPAGTTFIGLGTIGNFWNTFEDTANPSNGVVWGGTRVVENTWANTTAGQTLENYKTSCRCLKD